MCAIKKIDQSQLLTAGIANGAETFHPTYLSVKKKTRQNRKERKLAIVIILVMKSLKEITATIETLKPILNEQYGVETIGVFGSYTRGEQTQKAT